MTDDFAELDAAAIERLLAGAAAASGHLPDPVQAVVHDVVHAVGIDVPDGDHGDDTQVDEQHESPDAPATTGATFGGHRDEAPGRPTDPGRSEDAPGQDGQ